MTERWLDPDLAVTHLDRTGRNVVGPEIEGAAARQIEAGVMPVAGQDPIVDAAAFEWETHVRTTIIKGEDASSIVDHQYRRMTAMHHKAAFLLQIGQASHMYEVRGRIPPQAIPHSIRLQEV